MGRCGGCGSGGPEVARSAAHKASTSARTGTGGWMRPIWRRYTRKRSRARSRSLNGGQRGARSAGSVRVVSTSSCLGESIISASFAVPSHRRLDILVEAEQVRWVELVLQFDQPFVLCGAVGCLDAVFALTAQVVDIDGLGRERLHSFPEAARPADIRLSIRRVGRVRARSEE